MDKILFLLLKKGANRNAVEITTSEIGSELNISQQTASRRLIELEKEGKINRKNKKIILTSEGIKEIKEFYAELKNAFEKEKLIFNGKIVEGFKEGKYYVSKYKSKIKKTLGFTPFEGTLNVKISDMEKRYQIRQLEPIVIEGFKTKGRSFGDIFAYRCSVNRIPAVIIIPTRTHHGMDILEIISKFNLKKKLKKKTGEEISVEVDK